MTDPRFRAALAAHGYSLDDESGEITELAAYAGAFSARARQIETNIDRYEAEWRGEHPGEEPGPALRQSWDRRAWSDARPDKVVPVSGEDLRSGGSRSWGISGSSPRAGSVTGVAGVRPGELDRDAMVETALTRLGSRRSAWNPADARGEVEKLIASAGVVVDGAVRRELAEDLAARVVEASRPLLGRDDVPEHIRSLTSPRVLAVERELVARITRRADAATISVVEGAAGSGKTRRLAAQRAQVEARGGRMLVVTPTRKAAQVASGEVGTAAHSVAWLLHQHGYRWDEDGRWGRVAPAPDAPRLDRRTSWSSTRPGCSTRTPPGRSSSSPTPPALAWRWSATGTSSRRRTWGSARPRGPLRTRPRGRARGSPPVHRSGVRRPVPADAPW